MDDREAVARFLKDRDETAFGLLYDRHTPKLYGLALRLTGGAEGDAAEIVQEVWTRAIPKLDGFRWQSSLGTWLGSFVVNCWREHRRKGTHELEWEAEMEDVTPGRPERPGTGIDVTRALDGLPTGYRTVLVLFGVYGYSHHEIANLLGISIGTSKSQLSRARNALREALA